MKVFKFGGASVKDANSVRNVVQVMQRFKSENIWIVLSAMGKTTNALEDIVDASITDKDESLVLVDRLKKFHADILAALFPESNHPVFQKVDEQFKELSALVLRKDIEEENKHYDAIVSRGEILSTLIVSAFLNESGINNTWLDAREVICTDASWREGKVDWDKTEKRVREKCVDQVIITQGFIGSSEEGDTTTLGREGSDYTAAILAYCANAESVTIWKDVPGVMNADPKWFDATEQISQMSYQDAIELSYYGATVIHPKTIKPLQNKKIPLHVRSFIQPEESGTLINDQRSPLPVPCFIFKVNQVLLSISPKDFSFIVEENFSDIFNRFARNKVKIHVMQNSAISFSICADHDAGKIPELIKDLQKNFRVLYNEGVELITIRYYDQSTIDRVCLGKKVFLEHKSRYTVQLVVKDL